eukprot:gene10796-gene820
MTFLGQGEATREDQGNRSAPDVTLVGTDLAGRAQRTMLKEWGSDHLPMVTDIRMHRPPVSVHRSPRWHTPKPNTKKAVGTWKRFAGRIESALREGWDLKGGMHPVTPSQKAERLAAVMLESACTYIGRGVSKRTPIPWWNSQCDEALKARREARKAAGSGEPGAKEALKEARLRAAEVFNAAKAEAWRDYVETLNVDTDPKEVWKTIHNLAGNGGAFGAIPALLAGGKVLATDEQKAEALARQYAEVSTIPGLVPEEERRLNAEIDAALSREAVAASRENDPLCKPFTMSELKAAIAATKAGKAAGPDE